MNQLAAIYARVSSDRQKEDKTIGSQTAALAEYAQAHHYVVPKEWTFEDEGYSGATLARPGLERLRDVVNEGRVEVVLVHSPDRLSRRYAYQVLLLEEFSRKGVEVVFLKGTAGQTPEEQLLVQFQGMIAEYERAQIAERSRRGKRHRARAGCVNVLSGAPYGYRYIKRTDTSDSCYVVNEDEAAVVRQVYGWYAQDGLSIGEIARRLNAQGVPTRKAKPRWERSVVWAMLRNPAYAGRAAFGKTERAERKRISRPLRQRGGFSRRCSANRERPREQWIEIAVPALVPEAVFARAQERLAENQRLSRKNTKELTLLQGLLVCGRCGYSLYRTSTRTTKRQAKYYRCLGADGWRRMLPTPCLCRPIRVEDLDEAVWSQVERLLEEPVLIRAELERRRDESLRRDPQQQRRQRLQQDLQRVGQQIDKLLDAYQEGLLGLAELRQRMPGLRKKQATAQKEMESAHWQALAEAQLQQLDQSLESFLNRVKRSAKNIGIAEKQKIIRLLVKEVIVEKDAITIRHCIPTTGGGTDDAGAPAVPLPVGPAAPVAPSLNPKKLSDEQDYQVCLWRERTALRHSTHRSLVAPCDIDAGAKVTTDQTQDAPVAHLPRQPVHQDVVADPVEKLREIQVHRIATVGPDVFRHEPYRVTRTTPRPEAEAMGTKPRVEDRPKDLRDCLLDQSIQHRRDTQ
jgi:site-specific DNA recombinase